MDHQEILRFVLNNDATPDQIYKKTGIVYIAGRDKELRPTIVITLKNINYNDKNEVSNFGQALKYICLTIEKNLLYPGVVENWNVIIDASDVDVSPFTTEFGGVMKNIESFWPPTNTLTFQPQEQKQEEEFAWITIGAQTFDVSQNENYQNEYFKAKSAMYPSEIVEMDLENEIESKLQESLEQSKLIKEIESKKKKAEIEEESKVKKKDGFCGCFCFKKK